MKRTTERDYSLNDDTYKNDVNEATMNYVEETNKARKQINTKHWEEQLQLAKQERQAEKDAII